MSAKGYKIRYATAHGGGITVTLPFDPRKHECDACGKSVADGEIKTTQLHHWVYAFKSVTVKKNPELALKNTSEFCFYCHQIADGVRALLTAIPERVVEVIEVLPKEQRERMIIIFKQVIEMWNNKQFTIENPALKQLGENLGIVSQKLGIQ